MTANLYSQVVRSFKGIDHSLEKGEVNAVIESLRKVEKACRLHPLEKRLKSYWAQINSAGGMILARAQELEQKNEHVEALRLLRDGAANFAGAKVQGALRMAANRVRRSKEGRLAQKVLDREDRSRPEFEKGRKAEQGGDYLKAASHYRKVMSKAKETPLARRAEARLAALKKDPDIGKLIAADEQAAEAMKAYRRGLKLLRRGETEAGRSALRDVIKKWPDTPAARKARSALEKSG
jgi:TolA-binding protein